MVVPGRLWLKTQFPLVPNRQNADLILGSHESIQGDIARLTVGNDQLAQFAFYASANQGMQTPRSAVVMPSLANDFSHPICKIAGVDGVSGISATLPPVQKVQ